MIAHEIGQGIGLFDEFHEAVRPVFPHVGVGIVILRQPHDTGPEPAFHQGLDGAPGRPHAGLVRIVDEVGLLPVPRQEPGLFPRQRRSAQGDHPLNPLFMQAEQVHVSFHDQCLSLPPQRVPGLIQPVEHLALPVDGGFG